jgi:hypothetical protein
MPGARFRAVAARMDAVLVARLGDRGVRQDGVEIFGAFFSPFIGAELGGGHRIGVVANTDDVLVPTFTARTIDAADLVKGVQLTIDLPVIDGGGVYVVVKSEPDGAGMVVLKLRLT